MWYDELPLINNIEIPRYYFGTTQIEKLKSIQIHCFTDASEKAYGAVIYIRYTDENDVVNVSFLVSKSRVSPIKKLTIPRLELTAALIGARLNSHIQPIFKDLHLEVSYHFWSDSNIALCWIKNSSSKWKPYIANRVREIQNLTNPESWHHCPGNLNPADIITRKRKMLEIINCKLWWAGPDWLHENENNWPKSTEITPDFENLNLETRKNEVILLTTVKENLFDLKRFEKLSRMFRVTAWIKRFINNLKTKYKNTDPLNSTEILEAEHFWISYVQELAFGPEKQALLTGKDLPNCSRIKEFDPFLDDRNIIRVGGRLQNADVTEDERHPILLPYDNELSVMLIKDCHNKIGHFGLTATLTQLRSNYYILKARKLLKSVISKCLVCKRYRAKNFIEKTAPLPTDRVHMCPVFEVTGIDFAGPLYVKESNYTKKAYICLFTCATVRAVHLEIVSDLRTETFILAFKRFIGRRGLCKTIYSDNAATFKKGDKELQLWLESSKNKLQEYFGSQKIEWKYIVPLAAWWGGFWERMIRSVKTCLRKILGKALLTYEEMTTVIVEVEAILNSRPLTYNYEDCSEPTPLTPAHFLVGRRLTSLPTRRCIPERGDLKKRIKYQQNLIDHFWRRWKSHYLLELRSNHTVSPSKGTSVKVNDIVLIAGGPHEPRQLWQLGKVIDVFVGRDGKIRACSIKTAQGTVRRAVQLLYNLEIT